jgi:hypothetical protein
MLEIVPSAHHGIVDSFRVMWPDGSISLAFGGIVELVSRREKEDEEG